MAHVILYAYYGTFTGVETIKLLWPNLRAHEEELVEKEPQHWLLLHYIDLYDFATYLMYGEVQLLTKCSIVNAVRRLLDDVIVYFNVSSTSTTGDVEMMVRVLREIYTRIPAEEGGLRAEVTALCLSRWHELLGSSRLQAITNLVEKLEPFGSQIGKSLRLEEYPA